MNDNTRSTRAMVSAMATDLADMQATASERDAIRALTAKGYRMGDVAVLAEDALFEARQRFVTVWLVKAEPAE